MDSNYKIRMLEELVRFEEREYVRPTRITMSPATWDQVRNEVRWFIDMMDPQVFGMQVVVMPHIPDDVLLVSDEQRIPVPRVIP